MSFEQLLKKVEQAEQALEARERSLSADWRQLKGTWLATWTPGRIVAAGLLSGFTMGFARPLKGASGSGTLQLLSTVAGLFAGGSAQAAAGEAEKAAETAERTQNETTASKIAINQQAQPHAPRASVAVTQRPYEVPETFRGSGQI